MEIKVGNTYIIKRPEKLLNNEVRVKLEMNHQIKFVRSFLNDDRYVVMMVCKCINNFVCPNIFLNLEEGKEYLVVETLSDNRGEFVYVINDNNEKRAYSKERFDFNV